MSAFEFSFMSTNKGTYPKRITAYVVEPREMTASTGLLHCAHGWGGNRFQYTDLMAEFADRYNVLCVATEYRQSGYDFDGITGLGADVPYDASHYQVFDCLNTVREALRLYPAVDRSRLMAFGGSQGGHITMLMAIFAPQTFACAISGSGVARMDAERGEWAGREFSPDELAIRDVVRMASRVRCSVAMMHGTADATVPVSHTRELETALCQAGEVEVRARYYEGGGHALEPVTDRRTATIELADDWLHEARRTETDDFAARRKITIPCVAKSLVIDWSKGIHAPDLLRWKAKRER